jgi:pSer/pThr/pTyr-binding forkhead associated (FHA) protein
MPKVIVKLDNRVIKEIPIDKAIITIGRNPACDIQIDNLAVSVSHARILKEGEGFVIEDMGSLNGTFLGGKRITRSELSDGAEFAIGKHTLVFFSQAEKPRKPRPLLDETMILDTRKHREMSGKAAKPESPFPGGEVGILKVVAGSAEKPSYELTGPFATIGKAEGSDIRIRGIFAPSIAALIHRTGEGYFVSPPEKGKRPRLNGEPVRGRTALFEGDTLEAGGVKLVFFVRQKEGG